MLRSSTLAELSAYTRIPLTVLRVSRETQERRWRCFEPLWVTGLALLCLLLGHLLFGDPLLALPGKSYDYAQYAIVGTLFPLLLFGIPLIWRWRHWPESPLVTLRRCFAIGTLVWVALFLVSSVEKYGLAVMILPPTLALAQVILMGRPWRRDTLEPELMVAAAIVAIVAWTVVIAFLLVPLMKPPVFLMGFVAALVLACSATWDVRREPDQTRVPLRTPANVAAIVFIAFMSLRTDGLFDALERGISEHHWSPWVGPAELVRQGGWLLWDVPSMYGFLSILTVAAIPTHTPWQSFYLLNAASFFLVATGVFLILRALRPGWLNWCLALAAAVAVPLVIPTYDPSAPILSTFVLPNSGAYRYIWCFLLLMLLVWERTFDERNRGHRWLMTGGCMMWVVGVLWSVESAFFCSGAWLPAYAVIVLQKAMKSRQPWRYAGGWIALPPAMLTGSIALLAAFYAARLGRLPDWVSFVEFVFGIGTEVLVAINDPTGSALGILLGFCLLATAAWYAAVRNGMPTRTFALFAGLLGAFWATGIYGYTREVYFLHPMGYVALIAMLAMIAQGFRKTSWATMVRAGAVPLLTLLLVSPLAAVVASPLAFREAAISFAATAQHRFTVEPLLPDADASLQALLAEAGVGPHDLVSFQGNWLGNLMQPWRPGNDPAADRVAILRDWLPGQPYVSLRYVPGGRGAMYLRRFIDRVQAGGWLIQHKTGETAKPSDQHEWTNGREPWFFPTLGQTHVPTRIFENEEWQLVWFDYVGGDASIARPIYTDHRGLAPLPADVTVDGQPLAGQRDPAIWVLPGPGWDWYDREKQARWVEKRASLWMYSQTARDITLEIEAPADSQPRPVLVATSERRASTAPKRQRKADEIDQRTVGLRAGWNRVELRLMAENDSETTVKSGGNPTQDGATRKDEMLLITDATSPDGWFISGLDIQT